jgi:hypothetical protein
MSTSEFLSRASKTKAKASEIKEKDDVELPFCKYAERNGCKALKLIYLRKKGFPDRTVICPGGKVFFIEFKRPGKPLEPLQKIAQSLLLSFGFEYYVCDQPGQAEKILDNFLAFSS